MQINIDSSRTPAFYGVKMKVADRKNATQLIQEYLKTPSLKVRDEIFEIFDPYMQRHARSIAADEYYYDDVLQNMRLNLFSLLDFEQSKQAHADYLLQQISAMKKKRGKGRMGIEILQKKYETVVSSIVKTAKQLKLQLVHKMSHTDAKIPQKDETLVAWHSLSAKEQEQLIPAERYTQKEINDTVEMFLKDTKLSKIERYIMESMLSGFSFQDIAQQCNLSGEAIRCTYKKAIAKIQKTHNIEPKDEANRLNGHRRKEIAGLDSETKVNHPKSHSKKRSAESESASLVYQIKGISREEIVEPESVSLVYHMEEAAEPESISLVYQIKDLNMKEVAKLIQDLLQTGKKS